MWSIVSSQQHINTILKITLVTLTLKSIRIMNVSDTKQTIQILIMKQKYTRL